MSYACYVLPLARKWLTLALTRIFEGSRGTKRVMLQHTPDSVWSFSRRYAKTKGRIWNTLVRKSPWPERRRPGSWARVASSDLGSVRRWSLSPTCEHPQLKAFQSSLRVDPQGTVLDRAHRARTASMDRKSEPNTGTAVTSLTWQSPDDTQPFRAWFPLWEGLTAARSSRLTASVAIGVRLGLCT